MSGRVADATVAVLLGGTSGERPVSLVSGGAVLEGLAAAGGRAPRDLRRVEIETDGRWNDGAGPASAHAVLARQADVDVFFLALHGGDGEGGRVQGLLGMSGFAYTGSGVASSALCLDKWSARAVVEAAGVHTAPGVLVTAPGLELLGARLDELVDHAGRVFVKPRNGGSSVLTTPADTAADALDAARAILDDGDDALVEACIAGVEATSAVLGVGAGVQALTPVEIRPADGRFFDFEEKYSEAGAIELCPPETLGDGTCDELGRLGHLAHAQLGCFGYSRSDFIVPAEGDPVYLETNTLPGMTPRSLFPQAAADRGIDFPALCATIAEHALQREERFA